MCFAAAPSALKAEVMSARASCVTAVLLTLISGVSPAAELAIESPKPDSLVATSTITLRGTADAGDGVMLQVENADAVVVESAGGQWRISDVPLVEGPNVVTVTTSTDVVEILVTSAPNIDNRAKQKVFLRWDPETATELIKIATGTLQPVPNGQKQASFVKAVKQKTATIIADNFSRFNVEFVATPDEETYVINFMPTAGSDLYGHSMTDCLNEDPSGQSEVWVGSMREAMVPLSSEWAPMQHGDTLALRIADVAHALARTASHELGHGLGLVSGETPIACSFMAGCLDDHNCPAFDTSNRLADRFDSGRHIMDPGTRTTPLARIAESSKQVRGTRLPATFERFSSDYLLQVQPR